MVSSTFRHNMCNTTTIRWWLWCAADGQVVICQNGLKFGPILLLVWPLCNLVRFNTLLTWSVTRRVALNILSSSFVVGRAGCCKSLVIQCVALFPCLWVWVLRWMCVLITWIQILRMIRVGSKKQEVECSSKGWIRTGGWAALAFSSLLSHLVSAGDPTVCSVMHQQVNSTV